MAVYYWTAFIHQNGPFWETSMFYAEIENIVLQLSNESKSHAISIHSPS